FDGTSFRRHTITLTWEHVMKHVVKQEWMGCAIASAAMIGDLSYEEVSARVNEIVSHAGFGGLAGVFADDRWSNVNAARLRFAPEMIALLGTVTNVDTSS